MKKCQLLLLRDMYDHSSTTRPVVGKLFLQCFDAETNELIDESFICDTLEPPACAAHPCIPIGSYVLKMSRSPKFGRVLPRFIKVPGRTGILIHSGNSKEDTRGCILVGRLNLKHHDYLTKSREALAKLISYIEYFNISSIKVDIDKLF